MRVAQSPHMWADGPAQPGNMESMTKDQLVAKLREMRETGKADRRGRVGAMQHLFGIIFAKEIAASGANPPGIAQEAGVPAAEAISDGRNLAEYVTVKPEIEKRWHCVTRSGEESPITQDDLLMVHEEALASEGTSGEREVAGEYPEASVALITAAGDLLRVFLDVPPPRAGPDPVTAAVERAAASLEAARAGMERSGRHGSGAEGHSEIGGDRP